MDLSHLVTIGLQRPACSEIILRKADLQRQALVPTPSELDTYFASTGAKTLLQKVFTVPYKPQDHADLQHLLAWMELRGEQWPELAAVHGGPEIAAAALLGNAVAICKGDLSQLNEKLHEAVVVLRTFFAQSTLCQALMRGEKLWDVAKVERIFSHASSPLPRPMCGHSRYTQLKWVAECNQKVFLSVDMREANLSALRIMAGLVDPVLCDRISGGWVPLLESLLDADAELFRASKPLREIVLGGIERTWLRQQQDLCGVDGVDVALQSVDGKTLLQHALGDETASSEKMLLYRKAFKSLRGRISSAYTQVEHRIIRHVAAELSALDGLQLFAIVGDEAVFMLEAQSLAEAGAHVLAVQGALQGSFADDVRADLSGMFRIEIFLVHDLGQDVSAPGGRAMLAMTRRLTKCGEWERFHKLKGVRKELTDEDAMALSKAMRAVCSSNVRGMV